MQASSEARAPGAEADLIGRRVGRGGGGRTSPYPPPTATWLKRFVKLTTGIQLIPGDVGDAPRR